MVRGFGARFTRHHYRPKIERLEDRTTPSGGNYAPPNFSLIERDAPFAAGAGRSVDAVTAAVDYVRAHAAELGMTSADAADPFVTSHYADADTGISHVYLRQKFGGLPVARANMAVSVLANGRVFTAAGGFVPDLANKVSDPAPGSVMSALDTLRLASSQLGLEWDADNGYVDSVLGPVQTYAIDAPRLSLDVIPASLTYVPTEDGSAALAWDFVLRVPGGEHWYNAAVDAVSGTLLAASDWIDDAMYHAVPTPNESPGDGGTAILVNPQLTSASPHGWHDTNGVAGAEFTDTRGNNVDAHLDRDNNDSADGSPPRPQGGAALNFAGYSFDATSAPSTTQNMNSAVVNLFYMNNWIHDVTYQYGFTDVAGNFQQNNYGKGGSGNDAVQADAQDGSGTNNANFGTPPDGFSPRMQMFVWTAANPDRDSDLDNGVIVHEYTHGISNRLTGGPADANALDDQQSGGMGEGWGDFLGLMFMQRPTDSKNAGYGIGTYLQNQAITGPGIRRFRYSYDMQNVNPLMWDAYGSGTATYNFDGPGSSGGTINVTRSTEVHNTGELWAATLWDLNWLLIDKYGFDPNLATGYSASVGPAKAGNKLALRLVMDGMKLQPANPSFTDARDGILAADLALTGGQNQFEIWSAFARRGLGENANDGGSTSTATIVADTQMPMLVAGVTPAAESVVGSGPLNYVVTFTAPVDPGSITAGDFKVNGQAATSVLYTAGQTTATFTFAVNPAAGQGPQQIAMVAGAVTRDSDSSPIGAFGSTFYVDSTPLSIASFTPTTGSTLSPPSFTVDVNLNLAIDPASAQTSDLSITRGRVSDVQVLNSDKTVRFTVTDIAEGTFTFQFAKGAFTDADGNPSAANAGGSYTLEYAVAPFTTPFNRENPVGSFIYEGSQFGQIGAAADTDAFTLDLEANQTATVVVTPAASLRPALTVTGPSTNLNNTAAANGAVAQLSLIPISAGGTYTITLGGAASTTGSYTISVILNTTDEAETSSGANDTPATAESLAPAFIDLGNGINRAAVLGTTDIVSVAESESNNTTGTADSITLATAQPTNLYQMGLNGTTSSGSDIDYYSLGTLQAGDVITMTMSGSYSSRGTHPDTLLQLRRLNGGPSAVTVVASDDDGGPHDGVGGDSLIYRFTITDTDSYYARLYRAGTASSIGTYQLGIMLENFGPPPATGGSFPGDVEPNGSSSVAVNTFNLWKQVKYLSTASGSITASDTDYFAYSLNAGEYVTLNTRAMSPGLIPQTALLNSGGTVLATEDGTSNVAGAGGQSPVYGYVIPTTGTYYYRVTGASGSTGDYVADLYRSTTVTLSLAPDVKDHYSFTLAAGETASVAIDALSSGNVDLAIVDAGGAVLASSTIATNFDEVAHYTAPAAGTFYVRVSGDDETQYAVVVTRGASIDAEVNNSFPTAQSIDTTKAAFGAISTADNDWFQFNATTGQLITLTTSTPGGGAGEPSNGLDPTVELYDPTAGMIAFDLDSAGDSKNATLTKAAPLTGSYRARVLGASSTIGEYVLRVSVDPAPTPAKIAGVVIDDNTAQRSRIRQLVVNFDQAVTLPPNPADAFQLATLGGSTVGLSASAANSPNTSVTITFTGGSVDGTSLADGRYTLTAIASQISAGNFDGDGNGTAGDNYVLASDASPNPPSNVFRLFGDVNGDGFTDNVDLVALRAANGSDSSSANWNPAFDSNGDDFIDNVDFLAFRGRLGVVI